MSTEQKIERRYGAIVVGGGQAGLSASYWLARAGVDHVVFEKKSVMHKWREERWDTFCLVTPNWQCQLPGHAYEGPDPHGFMVKHEILAYLDGFARKTNGSVREGVEVLAGVQCRSARSSERCSRRPTARIRASQRPSPRQSAPERKFAPNSRRL